MAQDQINQEPNPYNAVGFDELVVMIERAKERLLVEPSLTVDERTELYVQIVQMTRASKAKLRAAHERLTEIFGRSPFDAS